MTLTRELQCGCCPFSIPLQSIIKSSMMCLSLYNNPFLYWVTEPGFKKLWCVPGHCVGLYPGAEMPWNLGLPIEQPPSQDPSHCPARSTRAVSALGIGHLLGDTAGLRLSWDTGQQVPCILQVVGNRAVPQPGVRATLFSKSIPRGPQTPMKLHMCWYQISSDQF